MDIKIHPLYALIEKMKSNQDEQSLKTMIQIFQRLKLFNITEMPTDITGRVALLKTAIEEYTGEHDLLTKSIFEEMKKSPEIMEKYMAFISQHSQRDEEEKKLAPAGSGLNPAVFAQTLQQSIVTSSLGNLIDHNPEVKEGINNLHSFSTSVRQTITSVQERVTKFQQDQQRPLSNTETTNINTISFITTIFVIGLLVKAVKEVGKATYDGLETISSITQRPLATVVGENISTSLTLFILFRVFAVLSRNTIQPAAERVYRTASAFFHEEKEEKKEEPNDNNSPKQG